MTKKTLHVIIERKYNFECIVVTKQNVSHLIEHYITKAESKGVRPFEVLVSLLTSLAGYR